MSKCPKCHKEEWRCVVYQSVDVDVDNEFYPVDNGFDFSEPDLQKEKVFCGNCGFEPFTEEVDELAELVNEKVENDKNKRTNKGL